MLGMNSRIHLWMEFEMCLFYAGVDYYWNFHVDFQTDVELLICKQSFNL